MSIREQKVLQHALVLKLDKDGKKVKRFKQGDIVKLDTDLHDIDRLRSLKAVGDKDAAYPTPRECAQASIDTNQGALAEDVDDGESGGENSDVTHDLQQEAARQAAEQAAANAAAEAEDEAKRQAAEAEAAKSKRR